jgi:acetyl-CoA carboxylase biotin carboxyl carrier protein
MDISDLEKVLHILMKTDVTDFELEQDGTRIHLVRSPKSSGSYTVESPNVVFDTNLQLTTEPLKSSEFPANFVKVESPIVGTFYRKPNPESEAFVSIGSTVKKGETMCIIEAMKLMNEIPAPCDGKVEAILIEDSRVVEYGEIIFIINPG